jgi:hypothetical protein
MEVSRHSVREGEQARTETRIDVSYLSFRVIQVGSKSRNDPDWNTIDFRRCPKISGCGWKICDCV